MDVREQVFVAGSWSAPTGSAVIEVTSPVTEEVVGRVAAATAADVDSAVTAGERALRGPWAELELEARIAVIAQAATLLESHAGDIAALLAREMGAPVGPDGLGVVPATLRRMRFGFPSAAREITFEQVRWDTDGAVLVRQRPIGVVGAIVPWNTPFTMAALKVVPGLLAGCPVVLKPSPLTPLDAFELAEALTEAGLPEGMLSVLPGGPDVGEAIAAHPGIQMVTFTGSSPVGSQIAAKCGEQFKRVVLECGGKSAALLLADADLEVAMRVTSGAVFGMTGQYCRSLSRVLVPRSRQDEVVDALCDAAAKVRIGDPLDPATTMGPLVSARQRDKVEGFLTAARDDGATVACGGGRPGDLQRGWFVAPTVLVNVDNSMPVAREEIFGPVALVIAYDSVEEAVAIANDSPYGLAGTVFSRDTTAALAVARRIESGLVGVNAQGARENAPCGGMKASGIGQEHGPEGQREFLRPTSIIIPDALAVELEERGTPAVRFVECPPTS